ncbi:hypothetical protein AVEN_251800-1 [Araneus ventricosus]|uniref:Uncharacterized protein n=1 Tax=Araneus ventricosus TaxID=182803 RepID=A0A4Y2N2L3_ARAVE|nr:hypothetical protein AVEN_251800-1 [Araneus ventricosus]
MRIHPPCTVALITTCMVPSTSCHAKSTENIEDPKFQNRRNLGGKIPADLVFCSTGTKEDLYKARDVIMYVNEAKGLGEEGPTLSS